MAACSRTVGELEELGDALRGQGAEVIARGVDVTRSGEVDAFAGAVREEFGRADVLLACAGVLGPVGPVAEVDPAAWERTVEVNLTGVLHAVRSFVPLMRASGGGRIITMSGGGIGGAGLAPRLSAYLASKAAVVGLTEALARELSAEGISVNALAPGAINTTFVDPILEAGPAVAGEALYAATARQRAGGDPLEKVGAALLFLASERSAGLTGKLVSAKWDDLDVMGACAEDLNRRSAFTLRRIDSVLFDEVPAP